MGSENFNLAFQGLVNKQLPSATTDSRALLAEVMRRDKRRVRLLAGCSLFFWLLGCAGMLLLVLGLDRLVIYIRVNDSSILQSTTGPSAAGGWSAEDRMMLWSRGTDLIHHSLPYIGGSIIAWMLAALFTVMLIFSSRQATFNRINFSLMQISQQLVKMRGAGNGSDERALDRPVRDPL